MDDKKLLLKEVSSFFPLIAVAVVWRCSIENALFEILQNSQESTYARVSFFNEVADLTLQASSIFYRTPPAAASVIAPT